ncbi:MAG: hypothetical protein FWF46_08590 [Oscillospiraceae bacterium]|nr:hypothetical protein [Oscillospiraceae bacterium]
MGKLNLDDFQKKFNLDNSFIEIVASLFDKLVSFGYIGNSQKSDLIEKLNQNVEHVILGTTDKYDYKSGYYDAPSKTLYVKDPTNKAAIYLRVLYAITTNKIDETTYNVGFSTTRFDLETHKRLVHENFAINRTVFANLTCKLLNALPTSISIEPSNATYSHDFLGHAITSGNDMYAMEGKILSEMCFALNLSEEIIYEAIFLDTGIQSLKRIFEKVDFQENKEFLLTFDQVSRRYSNYLKFVHILKLLNLNHIELKKKVLNPEFDEIKAERAVILNKLKENLNNFVNIADINEDADLTAVLEETLKKFEQEILEDITHIQQILANKIITAMEHLPIYIYISKLKQFNDMLIFPNNKISETIFNIIIFKIMECTELTEINIIQKFRYSLINYVLFLEKLKEISKKITFYISMNDISSNETSGYAIIMVNDVFSQIIKVVDLDKGIQDIENNCMVVKTDSLKQVINNEHTNERVERIEKIVEALKSAYVELVNIPLENIFIFSCEGKEFLIVDKIKGVELFLVKYEAGSYECVKLGLSESFLLFDAK